MAVGAAISRINSCASLAGKSVLLLGAGGASKGRDAALLAENPATIDDCQIDSGEGVGDRREPTLPTHQIRLAIQDIADQPYDFII